MAQSLRVEIVGDASGYARSLGAAAAATSEFGAKLGSVGKSTAAMGRSMTRNLTLPIVAVGVASVKMANDFSQSLTRMVGLAGVSQKQVNAWSTEILKLGPEVAKSPRELAAAMYEIASSGVPASKAMSVLTVSAKASTAGLGETRVVADAVTSVMNAYGVANITAAKATDVLVATVREGKGEASDFAPVIGNVASIAAQLGIKFEEVGAALAGMTRLGVDAHTAATQLNAVFIQLLKGSKQTEDGLKAVGLSTAGLRQELAEKGLLATLQTLKTAFHGNIAAMSKVFGNARALKGVLALIGKSADSTEQIFKRMGDTTGALAVAFDAARKKSGFKFDQLKASAEAAGIALGVVLMPTVNLLVGMFTRLAIAFENLSPHMQRLIAIGLAVAAVVGPMLIVFGSLASALGALAPVLAAVLSPLGLLIAGVALLAGAIAAAVLAPEQFAAALEKIGVSGEHAQQITSTLQGVFAQLKVIFQTAVADITAIWDRMGPSIIASSQAIWGLISSQVQGGLNIIRGIINTFAGLFTGDWSRVWQGLTQIFSGVWNNIVALFQFYLNQLIAVARGLWAALGPAFSAAWSGISSATSAAWAGIVGVVTTARNAMVAVFTGVGAAIGSALETAWTAVRTGALRAALSIVEPFSHIPTQAGQWARNLKDSIQGELDKIDAKKTAAKITSDFNAASGKAKAAGQSIGMQAAAGIAAVGPHLEAVGKASATKAVTGVNSVKGAAAAGGAGIGAAIGAGMVGGVSGYAQTLANVAVSIVLNAIAAARAAIGAKSPAKMTIELGKDFVAGLVQGIIQSQGLAEKAAARAAQRTAAAATAALVIASPQFALAARTLGLKGAEAVAMGVVAGTPSIAAQMKAALSAAVASARSDFVSKFDQMASAALAKFDARVSAWKPFSSGILAKMQLQDTIKGIGSALAQASAAAEGGGAALAATIEKDIGPKIGTAMSAALGQIAGAKTMAALATVSRAAQTALTQTITAAAAPAAAAAQAAVAAAQAALSTAQAGGDPAAIAAAQQALDTAVQNQQALEAAVRTEVETATGLLVTAEQTHHDQLAATQRAGLAQQLAELKTALLEHPKEWTTAAAAVQKVVDAAIAKMAPAGRKLATDFAAGIRSGIGEAVAAAEALASAVAAVMPVSSPAKKGPLAVDIYQAGKRWAQDFGKGIDAGGLSHTVSGMTRSNTPSTVGVGGGDAGGATVNVYVQGALLGSTVPEVAATIRREILRTEKRNVTAFAR